jgi:hypothetical protein
MSAVHRNLLSAAHDFIIICIAGLNGIRFIGFTVDEIARELLRLDSNWRANCAMLAATRVRSRRCHANGLSNR